MSSVTPVKNSTTIPPIRNTQVLFQKDPNRIDAARELEGLNLVDVCFLNKDGVYKVGMPVEQVLGKESIHNLSKLPKDARALVIIDVQSDFVDGSLLVPGAKEKIFTSYEEVLQKNQQQKLFDYIILTKDFHPKDSKTFTSKYMMAEKVKYGQGWAINLTFKPGVTPQRWWGSIHDATFNFPETNDSSKMLLVPKDQSRFEELFQKVASGKLAPFSKGLHPIPFNELMLPQEVERERVFSRLKLYHILNENGEINGDYTNGEVKLKEAFRVDAPDPHFNEAFVEAVAKEILLTVNETRAVLKSLLEAFWPDHCVQNDGGDNIDPRLVALLRKYCKDIPIVVLPKGYSSAKGEAYSAGKNTTNVELSSPLLYIKPKSAVFCGLATDYCAGNSTKDMKEMWGDEMEVFFWSKGSAGITPVQAMHDLLTSKGVKVVEEFPGLSSNNNNNNNNNLNTHNIFSSKYFEKGENINRFNTKPEIAVNILVGPEGQGFMGCKPTPLSSLSFDGAALLKNIDLQEQLVYDPVTDFATIQCLNFDKWNGLVANYPLDFTADISERAPINLPANLKEQYNIHKDAVSYAFVKPCRAFGVSNLQGAVASSNGKWANVDVLREAIINSLLIRHKDLAFLGIIGGYVYFNKDNQIVQAKPIAPRLTSDMLQMRPPQLMSNMNDRLAKEFNDSVKTFNEGADLRDKHAMPITAQELYARGARMFSYLPQNHIPDAFQRELDGLQQPLKTVLELLIKVKKEIHTQAEVTEMNQAIVQLNGNHRALYEKYLEEINKLFTFYKENAPLGAFLYHFNNPEHNCFIAIGEDPKKNVTHSKNTIEVVQNGVTRSVQAFFNSDSSCEICFEEADLVMENAKGEFYAKCCSTCVPANRQNDPAIRQPLAGMAGASPIVRFYPIKKAPVVAEKEFYKQIHFKALAPHDLAKVEFSQLPRSKSAPAIQDFLGMSGSSQASFVYPYPKLKSNDNSAALNQLYEAGGFVVTDTKGKGIQSIYIVDTHVSGTTRTAHFRQLTEITDKLEKEVIEELMGAAKSDMMPRVTIKALAKHATHFMYLPPNSPIYKSAGGGFLYVHGQSGQIFFKQIQQGSNNNNNNNNNYTIYDN